MSINITELSESDLKQKIEAIKAERERTANALKRYEDELERRKREVPLGIPLGIPLEDEMLSLFIGDYQFGFASEDSMHVFYERIKLYAETLQKIARGEPIDIHFLVPLLRKGYAAMFEGGVWCWFAEKPKVEHDLWDVESVSRWKHLNTFFNIRPVEDWTTSLMECGL